MTTPPRRIIRRAVDPAPTLTPPPRRALIRQPLPAPVKAAPSADQHKQRILEALDELDSVDASLAQLITRKHELESSITSDMEEGKLTSVTNGRYEVDEVPVKTKASRTIDAKVFFNVLAERSEKDEEAAWAAMSVTATEAGKLLTQVEMNKLFPMTPGKTTGTKIVISRVEVKSTKKSK